MATARRPSMSARTRRSGSPDPARIASDCGERRFGRPCVFWMASAVMDTWDARTSRSLRRTGIMAQGKRTAVYGLLGIGLVMAWMVACNPSSRDASAFTSAGVSHLQQGDYEQARRGLGRALG